MSASSLNTARPEWTAGQVEVDATSDFRVVLEGKASNGGFAIDQLVFTPGRCTSKNLNSINKDIKEYLLKKVRIFFI